MNGSMVLLTALIIGAVVAYPLVFGLRTLASGIKSANSEPKDFSPKELKLKRIRIYLNILSGILAIVALIVVLVNGFTWFFLLALFSALLLLSISQIMESEAQTVSPRISAWRTCALIMFALSIAMMILTIGIHFKII